MQHESDDFGIFKEMEEEYKRSVKERESQTTAASASATAPSLSSAAASTSTASLLGSSQRRASKLSMQAAVALPSVKDELEAKRIRMQNKLGGDFSGPPRSRPKIERRISRKLFHADPDEESDEEPEQQRPSKVTISSTSSSSEDEMPRHHKDSTSTPKRRVKKRKVDEGSSPSETSSEASYDSSDSEEEVEEVYRSTSSSRRSAHNASGDSRELLAVTVQNDVPAIIELAQYRLKLLADNTSEDESDQAKRLAEVVHFTLLLVFLRITVLAFMRLLAY